MAIALRPQICDVTSLYVLLLTKQRGLSVCRSITVVSHAKMAESIETPFGLWSWVGPGKRVLHGVHIDETWRIRLIRPYSGRLNEAVAMRSYVKLL